LLKQFYLLKQQRAKRNKQMKFTDLKLIPAILKALKDENYSSPTAIQAKAISHILNRKDVLGSAQTGTGKTAAFAIPIIQHLNEDLLKSKGKRKIQALIVTPTRELALQIGESFTTYGKYTNIRNTVIFGGVPQGAQVRALKNGVDTLIATPGRLLDLMSQGYISLRDIKYFVLDEADRMLDMGFIHDIKKLLEKLPSERQSLFFSATMPPKILKLSKQILAKPEKVVVNPVSSTAETIQQHLYTTNKSDKKALLLHILKTHEMDQVLLFSRTKHGADRIVRNLRHKKIESAAIHGEKSQNQRQKALKRFKDGELRVLVATDIAARGIDIDKLRYVINYDIPNESETYVHRIGRCGRAGEEGVAISICEPEENAFVKDIEKLIKRKIETVDDNPFPQTDKPMNSAEKKEFQKEKERKRQEYFANRNKKRGSQNPDFRRKKR
jgi:ATP-dependent RNA helicase RhlE